MPTQGEHTPGPWQALPPQGRARLHGIFDADGGCLAECLGQKAVANARLIAAAPDLLAALRALDTALCEGFGTRANRMAGRKALIAARAAIAKATGRTENEQPDNSGAEKTICQEVKHDAE